MSEQDLQYTVIAGYRFFDLPNPTEIRFPLRSFCRELGLMGTILLSEEGINSYVSGTHDAIARYKEHLHGILKFPTIDYKEHRSFRPAWRRMLVKVKKEIISMGIPDIRPADFTAESLAPAEFKKWLDEKKEITVIDTRNDYEVKQGKFSSAIDLNVPSFREFARKAAELPADLKKKPVVMYCTGGIRCEKASALFLKHFGFEQVYQLKGGILNYFKEVGGDHFEGECLVFDRRVALNGDEAETKTCFNCKASLSPAVFTDPKYVPFRSCPQCYLEQAASDRFGEILQ